MVELGYHLFDVVVELGEQTLVVLRLVLVVLTCIGHGGKAGVADHQGGVVSHASDASAPMQNYGCGC